MASRQTQKKTVLQPRKKTLQTRMRRIGGQIAGIQEMIERDRYCVDIMTQISAAKSALDSVAMLLLEDHTRHCVKDALANGGGNQKIEELVRVVKKYTK
ncbi:MAG: metal-sensitive transcriptional regulator [bacterium]|nr:metal-sensitive transcriptional regulator [bacterium]